MNFRDQRQHKQYNNNNSKTKMLEKKQQMFGYFEQQTDEITH